jgi:molybdate transport system substrate-binding protein
MGSVSIAQESRNIELNIFAAASLSEAFNALAEQFRALNGNVRISFNFAGSQQLAQQVNQGAPVDLLVTANMKQMSEAARSGRIDTASIRVFAHNRLVLVYPKDNVGGVHSLRDLRNAHLKIILADKAVPAGQYALDVLDKCSRSTVFGSSFRQEVLRNVVSYEENVKVVLSKIILGEADAGIVYASDVSQRAPQDVGTIEIPEKFNVVALYPIAVVLDSKRLDDAEKFMTYVFSDEGQAVLVRFGLISISAGDSER